MKRFATKLGIAALLTSGAVASAQVDLTGAGASFPAPLIATWADVYRDLTGGDVVVNYQSIGSGGGISNFIEQTIHFGATEAFLNDEQLAQAEEATGGAAYNLPVTLADVVVTYNVPGVETGLNLTGEVIADIFLGNILQWDDAAIADLNEGVELPSMLINVAHRADGSGTTNIFTSYLSAVSDEWAQSVGAGTAVEWPTGNGAAGNEGVAGLIANTPGSIGYNSLVYATLNDLSYGYVYNQSGNLIEPSLASTSASADVELPEDTRVLIVDTEHPEGYPISGFAWALFYQNADQNDAFDTREEAEETVRFLVWAVTEGQEFSESLDFARLPNAAVESNLNRLAQVTWEGENIGQAIVDEVR